MLKGPIAETGAKNKNNINLQCQFKKFTCEPQRPGERDD